ncbi:hypothetical protein F5Y05DRAFT_361989 [Hypoxylon sp. FL0543]|nr:hypothetical protein F5Y05DRAFT_361989 [Hypoxylon sp. FL0543]
MRSIAWSYSTPEIPWSLSLLAKHLVPWKALTSSTMDNTRPTLTKSISNASIPHIGRLPCFGRIHTKSFPSTRTLDSKFLADYHSELNTLRRQWEARVLDYWEAYWDRFYSVQGEPKQESSTPDQTQLSRPSRPFKHCSQGFAILERNVQQFFKHLALKRHQGKAINSKRKIDARYRSQLGMRTRKTSAEDFPIQLDEFACYWDPWHVTEPQPTPYMRSQIGIKYIINEYYASDHELRLRKVRQKDATAAVTACFKREDFDELDVTTLYIYEPKH